MDWTQNTSLAFQRANHLSYWEQIMILTFFAKRENNAAFGILCDEIEEIFFIVPTEKNYHLR